MPGFNGSETCWASRNAKVNTASCEPLDFNVLAMIAQKAELWQLKICYGPIVGMHLTDELACSRCSLTGVQCFVYSAKIKVDLGARGPSLAWQKRNTLTTGSHSRDTDTSSSTLSLSLIQGITAAAAWHFNVPVKNFESVFATLAQYHAGQVGGAADDRYLCRHKTRQSIALYNRLLSLQLSILNVGTRQASLASIAQHRLSAIILATSR
ncbi:hypothetical protein BDV97DRAFT_45902 [Delphinella strobiligena]|nr:hypothetical protein BDV97DRAFT_45902 [Delphinella strobiligena]